MYELVIFAQFDPKSKMAAKEVAGDFAYRTLLKAEERAVKYLTYCPNDIVMLVGPE